MFAQLVFLDYVWRIRKMKDRFRQFKGYILDRVIFITAMWILFIGMFIFAYVNDFDLDYFRCGYPEEQIKFNSSINTCHNPFYKEPTWKDYEYLAVGEYGKNPSWYTIFLPVYLLGIAGITFIVNHLFHNRRKNEINKDNSNNK
jgi:hypothetical protein